MPRANPRQPTAFSFQQQTYQIPQPIVLVGTMGAGKSSIGRRLAKRLGLPFFDSDLEIEAAAGCSIVDFFERFGEAAFREGEAKIISRMIDEKPICVLATGGGAMKTESLRHKVYASTISIWMRADIDTLVKRVTRRNHRPLLNSGDPREILSNISKDDELIYSQANVIIDSHADAVNATVENTLQALCHFLQDAT
jgi:shikimate kinase